MINCGIDVGTNSVRMLIARVENGKIVEELHSERHITRLGAGINDTGILSPNGAKMTLELFKKFHEYIVRYNVDNVFAAATSAVREASDGISFMAEAEKAGIKLVTITGDEEANYTYMGISASLNVNIANCIVFDIGGGSTEISLVIDDKRIYSDSVRVGVVKLSDRFGFDGVFTQSMATECVKYIQQEFSPVFNKISALKKGSALPAIGTAGTVTTIAAHDLMLEVYDRSRVNGHVMNISRLESLLHNMRGLRPADILKLPGIEKGREDLVAPGIILVCQILRGMAADAVIVSESGLREGLTLAADGHGRI